MILKKVSEIHGNGIFATEHIKRGTLIVDWLSNSKFLNKGQYGSRTCIRLVGNIYLDGTLEDSDFVNHSNSPNAICLFGLVFALENIDSGKEITLDYGLLNAPDEFEVVQGYSTE